MELGNPRLDPQTTLGAAPEHRTGSNPPTLPPPALLDLTAEQEQTEKQVTPAEIIDFDSEFFFFLCSSSFFLVRSLFLSGAQESPKLLVIFSQLGRCKDLGITLVTSVAQGL